MKPLFDFLVSPVDGKRYDNVVKLADGRQFHTGASQEDHTVTQRHAEIVATPIWYTGDMKPGDIAIVHHNTFRVMLDMGGKELNSNAYIRENLYAVNPELLYMYKKPEGEWNAMYPFIFISPIENSESTLGDKTSFVKQKGIVEYSPDPNIKKASTPN